MTSSIDTKEQEVLLHFYNKLEQIIRENVNTPELDSLLLTLIKLPQNKNSAMMDRMIGVRINPSRI